MKKILFDVRLLRLMSIFFFTYGASAFGNDLSHVIKYIAWGIERERAMTATVMLAVDMFIIVVNIRSIVRSNKILKKIKNES